MTALPSASTIDFVPMSLDLSDVALGTLEQCWLQGHSKNPPFSVKNELLALSKPSEHINVTGQPLKTRWRIHDTTLSKRGDSFQSLNTKVCACAKQTTTFLRYRSTSVYFPAKQKNTREGYFTRRINSQLSSAPKTILLQNSIKLPVAVYGRFKELVEGP